jgi:hypothetical protein
LGCSGFPERFTSTVQNYYDHIENLVYNTGSLTFRRLDSNGAFPLSIWNFWRLPEEVIWNRLPKVHGEKNICRILPEIASGIGFIHAYGCNS